MKPSVALKVLFLGLILGYGIVCSSEIVEFVQPIKSLLNYLNIPLRVQIMICWDFDVRLEFYRRFSQLDGHNGSRNYQASISDANLMNFPNGILEEHQYLIIVDLNCNQTQRLLFEVGSKLTHRFKWIVLDSVSQLERDSDELILETFKNLEVTPSSEVYCLAKIEEYSGTVIKQVYRKSMEQELILELFGFCRNTTSLNLTRNSHISSIRRRNLEGLKLRASLVLTHNDSTNHLTDGLDRHIDTLSKVNYVLTTQLADFINGEIEFKFVKSWGYMNNESKWSGMIGDLVDNRSDIGASALFFTADRIKFIEYIAMPTPTRSKFVFRSPKLSYTDNVFLLPFDTRVWHAVIALIVVTSIALVFSTWSEFKIKQNEGNTDPGVLHPSALDAFILVFGATCQQGSAVSPRSMTSRIIMFIVFLMLMFLYTSYSANIVALLQSPSRKIQTLNDLLKSRLKLGADDTIFNRYYFTHTSDPVRQQIYQQKILNKDGSENFMTLEEGVELLREGLFAFHMEIGVGYKVVSETFREDEKCALQEIQYLQVIDPWYAIQKNSSYKELLKIGMMRIHEHGLQERENAILYTKKPKCTGGGGKFITASLVDTKPAILTLLWGYLFALAAIFFEILVYRQLMRYRNYAMDNMDNANN
ncbi:glutamate [NMDA] receptor subunit 1-like [Eupeodes corollae]|uniref:glutamate [NMDA] receptor subunit 1-like n=1 Tax=Eupeodes corollae TaxID=290404 RepID=UPI00249202AD|nr:glutamate [NMDA] receptor subunit 1-like [Eupeodes corollae]